MNANLDAILQDLAAAGRVLAFCDETNLTEQATATKPESGCCCRAASIGL